MMMMMTTTMMQSTAKLAFIGRPTQKLQCSHYSVMINCHTAVLFAETFRNVIERATNVPAQHFVIQRYTALQLKDFTGSPCKVQGKDISVCNRNYHTAMGNHMPHGIRRCYLPPGSGDFPAFTPAEAGTRFSDSEKMQG